MKIYPPTFMYVVHIPVLDVRPRDIFMKLEGKVMLYMN